MILIIIAAAIAFGLAIAPAVRADRADSCHLMHGPNSNCRDCEEK